MKKKIILSLLCTLIIAANVNCTNAYARTNSRPDSNSNLHFYSKLDNTKGKVFDNKKNDNKKIDNGKIDNGLLDNYLLGNGILDNDLLKNIFSNDIFNNEILSSELLNNIFSDVDLSDYFNVSEEIIKENAKEIEDSLMYQLYIERFWDNLEVEKDMDLYNSNDEYLGKPGDILIAAVDTDNTDIDAIMVGSLTTHAAFVDSDPSRVLELFQEGVLNCENDWRTRYKKVLVLRPNVDEKIISDAIEFGHTKVGTPFSYFSNLFDKTNTDKYYCSQYVWDCFLKAGVDLDGNGGKAVFPYDIMRSDKVKIVYKYGD